MAPRSIWNGTLAFGEIAVPVKLFSLVSQQRIQFREVRLSDGSRIAHRRVGSESGQEVPNEQIRKAYETPDGHQVVVSDEEITSTQGPRNKVLTIEHFVPAEQVKPVFYERPYVLGAQDGGEAAYRLLHAALQRTGKIAIGRFVLRTREQLAAVAAHEQALRLYTLRFADELVDAKQLAPPSLGREPSPKELQMAQRLIETLAASWEPEQYEDAHRSAVLALIQNKARGGKIETHEPQVAKPVPDLLAALEQSISAGGHRKPTKAKPKPATKPKRAAAKAATPTPKATKPKASKPKAGSR